MKMKITSHRYDIKLDLDLDIDTNIVNRKVSQYDDALCIKGNAQFIFFCNPQKSSVNVCLKKILKSTVTRKVIVCFYNLGEEKF